MKALDVPGSDVKADEAWTCDSCHMPTRLVAVSVSIRVPDPGYRFRSECCRAKVTPTKDAK